MNKVIKDSPVAEETEPQNGKVEKLHLNLRVGAASRVTGLPEGEVWNIVRRLEDDGHGADAIRSALDFLIESHM